MLTLFPHAILTMVLVTEMIISKAEMIISDPETIISHSEMIISDIRTSACDSEMIIYDTRTAVSLMEALISVVEMMVSEAEIIISATDTVFLEADTAFAVSEKTVGGAPRDVFHQQPTMRAENLDTHYLQLFWGHFFTNSTFMPTAEL